MAGDAGGGGDAAEEGPGVGSPVKRDKTSYAMTPKMKLITFDDLGYAVLAVARWFPLPIGQAIEEAVTKADRGLRVGRLRAIRESLERCFPESSAPELEAMLREVCRRRWSVRDRRPEKDQVEGIQHLREALARGKGAILWECPFGSRRVLHATLRQQAIPFLQVHGAEHGGSSSWIGQTIIRRIHRASERRLGTQIVDIQEGAYSYLRTIKERLAANGVVCMPGLGPKGRRFLAHTFLGREELFATGVASLGMSSGAVSLLQYPPAPEPRASIPIRKAGLHVRPVPTPLRPPFPRST